MSAADEAALLERLIAYDTSAEGGIRDAFAFLRGWLEGREIPHPEYDTNGLPSLVAAVGDGPRVPDHCRMDVDVRYLPTQSPEDVVAQIRSLGASVTPLYELPPADLDPAEPHVRILSKAIRSVGGGEGPTTGRDGASDAVFFLRKGIPSVEFGPSGEGHHGPEEYVEVESLSRYRQALVAFVQRLATRPDE